MRAPISLLACLCLLQVVVLGQDPASRPSPRTKPATQPAKPTHEPEALKLVEKMLAASYTPRAAGLTDLTCKMTVVQTTSKETTNFGPYTVRWTPTSINVMEEGGQAVSMDPTPVRELVGYDTMAVIKLNHLKKIDDRKIEVRVPKSARGPIRKMVLRLDKAGRLIRQDNFDAKDQKIHGVFYIYGTEGDRTVVKTRTYTRRDPKTGEQESVVSRSYTYQRVLDYVFPKTVTVQRRDALATITYTDIVVDKARAKESAPLGPDGGPPR